MTIDANRLDEMFRDSLFRDEEILELGHDKTLTVEHFMAMPEDKRPFVAVQGIIHKMAFNPTRLESHRDEVRAMLDQLPDDFKTSGGGGMSTLNMVVDRNGVQWAEHRNMEQLATMAVGLKLGAWPMPREWWGALPGGMPYFQYQDAPAVAP